MYIKVGRNFVDDCYKKGVVKPNEYRQVVRNLVDKELSLRDGYTVSKKAGLFHLQKTFTKDEAREFYEKQFPGKTLEDSVVSVAHETPEKLLMPKEDIEMLITADCLYRKAVIIRDCSDLLKSEYVLEEVLYIDKKTLWASTYLQKYSKAAYEILATLDTVVLN